MKTLLFMMLVLPLSIFAQRTENFGKFTDKDGRPVNGTSLQRGYERQLEITSLSQSGGSTPTVTITIPNSAAINAFQAVAGTKDLLKSAEISVLELNAERKVLKQKITMANVKVNSVNSVDGAATITLTPQSYNQVFYATDKSGKTKQIL